MNKTNFLLNKILRITVFIVSVIVTILLIGDTSLPQGMEYFPLVPFLFGVGYLLSIKTSMYIINNIGLLGLNITLIIRYVITPFFMWFNGHSIGRGATPSAGNYQVAVLLMIFELIVIFITIELLSNKFYKKGEQSTFEPEIKVNKNFIGSIFLFITLIVILLYPSLLERYSFVLTATEYNKKSELNLPFGSLFPLMVQFASMLLTITIVNKLYKLYRKKRRPLLVYTSIFIIFVFSSFIVGTSRFSMILPMVTGMYLITRLYPKYNNMIYSSFGLIMILFVTMSTLVKQFGTTLATIDNSIQDVTSSISSSLQVYFSGIHNIAIAVKTKELFNDDIDFGLIFGDLFSNVMLISEKFLSNFGGSKMFNYAFYNDSISTDQILPLIGQGYLYFGFFFSSIFIFIIIYFMMYFDKKSRKAKTVFEIYIYAYIAVRFGLYSMSNAIILNSFLINYFLLLLLIIKLNNKIVLFKSVNSDLRIVTKYKKGT